jgi:hypothetical protein
MRKSSSNSTVKWLLATSVVLALVVSPIALAATAGNGSTLKGGARNPGSNGSQTFTQETQIIADTSTYGTRQSNKSATGGGAIYGCRAKAGAGNKPCVRASNLVDGLAFQLSTGGPLAGTIEAVGGANAKPFTTNATGIATGLNADRVDSKSADEITAAGAKAATDAVTSGIRFASVSATGTLAAKRGVASAARTAAGTYQLVFDADASACVLTATEQQTDDAGAVGVQLGADKKTVTVVTRAGGGVDGTAPTAPADRPFHLQATCL